MATLISYGSYVQANDNHEGFCAICADFTRGECEPDARKYPCPDCGRLAVYGAEEALFMGLIDIGDEEDDFPD